MEWFLHFLALLLGGMLAASGLIIAKKPNAAQLIGKLAPFQGAIGVAMIVIGLIAVLDGALGASFTIMKFSMLLGLTMLSTVICELVVGFLLGMGLIARWIPGEGAAETKMLELQKKLMAIQIPLGIISIVTAILWLLFRLRIIGL